MLTANSSKSDSWLTCAFSIIASGCWYLPARSMSVQSKASWPALLVFNGSALAHDNAASFAPASLTTDEPPAPTGASTAASGTACAPAAPPAPGAPPVPVLGEPATPLCDPEVPSFPPVDTPPAPLPDDVPA